MISTFHLYKLHLVSQGQVVRGWCHSGTKHFELRDLPFEHPEKGNPTINPKLTGTVHIGKINNQVNKVS